MARPVVWRPPAEPAAAELAVIKAVRRAKLFVFLRLHRHELFDEPFQAELAQAYVDSPKGQPPVPPARLALATILQAYTNHTVDAVLAMLLLVGGVIGAQFGTRFGTRLRGEQLRFLLAILVLAVAAKLARDLTLHPTDLFVIPTDNRG